MESGRRRDVAEQIVLSRDFIAAGDRSSIYRAAGAGALTRIAPGAHIPTALWDGLDADTRFLARIAAEALLHPLDRPFSHMSAAALWGLPVVGAWPARVEALAPLEARLGSRVTLQRRPGPPDARSVQIDGIEATSLPRTVVDVARTRRTAVAVAIADRALRAPQRRGDGVGMISTSKRALLAELEILAGRRGAVRAADVVAFADGAAGSAGESLSRCCMRSLGIPAPVLQQEFRDEAGLIGYVDFWWPDFGIIGEFDGFGKYLRAELTGGRTVQQVVLDEKRREDRLRRLGHGMVRWGWREAAQPRVLERVLLGAGISRSASLRVPLADPRRLSREVLDREGSADL